MITDDDSANVTENVSVSHFEPTKTILGAYQEIIQLMSSFPQESNTNNDKKFHLSSRGREAMNKFKIRFQQMFEIPTGLSRIIPPDSVDESAFLPVLEKLKKQKAKTKAVIKK